ncbi:MAG: hypothetical protein WAM72_25125, partial [Xanthobacteraceae bacterium]
MEVSLFQLAMTRSHRAFFFGKVYWHHPRLDWVFSADHLLSRALITERAVIGTSFRKTLHHARVNPAKKAVRCLRFRVTSTATAAPVSTAPTQGSR